MNTIKYLESIRPTQINNNMLLQNNPGLKELLNCNELDTWNIALVCEILKGLNTE